ncbi:beta-galactosidase 8 isoform X2 [Pistacia vera]|uniref:beta-galactosidase 8 isoform X1 n=1 Tax=Pistacia vera TaxID=55513 RepID=UPI001263C851|nr:beta-galactosidase 8 isoform X1 [Pistacia vera]XP_031256446.1 beta-galactosidase 8 isoform X2 [Pistacia vera]
MLLWFNTMLHMRGREILVVLCLALGILATKSLGADVTYDHRAVVIDGKRRVLISGSIHYPRSTPEMWPDLIQKSKDGGLDVIETYVFWNVHEPVRNQYNFEGRYDIVKFVKLVAEAGLYVHLRIGPYVCAEWNYGGFPVWLHFVPGIELRTDNEPYKAEMQRFTTKIVGLMKQEKLYASQGGPIILSQIENEYGNIDSAYGAAAKSYIKWAASMAVSQDTGVPWVMCQQSDAPDPMINTCNGFYCDQFTPNSDKKPKMWTENWTGWFLSFGGAVPYRPVEDIAFAVARFFQRGGTFQNYYMYHGGTNFGRTTGGPFIATSYDYDAPLDEYGQLRQPKWGHLKDLHKAIKLCEPALVATDPNITSLGQNLEAAVYKSGSACAAFLANIDTKSDVTVNFSGNSYQLPAWSVSILPDCKNVVLNTAKINSVTVVPSFTRQSLKVDGDSSDAFQSDWSYVNEPVGISKKDAFTKVGLLEQINTTADKSDYLWYSLSTVFKTDEPFLQDGSKTVLHVESLGHGLHAFVNGKLAGSGRGSSSNAKVSGEFPVTLVPGKNTIDLLSFTVGLQNYGAFYDKTGAGITGPVQLKGLKNGTTSDLSSQQWTYQTGLQGEALDLPSGSSPQWVSKSTFPKNQPLIWYKTTFNAPAGNDPLAIDFTGMGKGEAWVNGQSIGRYWPTYGSPNGGCTNSCNYRGSYSSNKCLKNCGKPSQELYHLPRSWLKSSGNILVLFEEIGGDPTKITFATKQIGSLCSHVTQSHPLPVDMWNSDSKTARTSGPVLSLECPLPNQVISSIKFASFGTPNGTCGSFSHGNCSSKRALSIVHKACVGSKSCSIGVSSNTFGDPCTGVIKSLAVEASCT